jgi:chaperonin GroES
MNIRPYGDRILVKRLEDETEKTAAGLYIPDSAKEKPAHGEVVAVGEGKLTPEGKLLPIKVKAGDRVLFGKYAGNDVPKIFGEDYLLIRDDEIQAVVEGIEKKAKA